MGANFAGRLAVVVACVLLVTACADVAYEEPVDPTAAAARSAGAQLLTNPIPDPSTGWRAAVLPIPIPRPAFTLTDTEGEPFEFGARTAGELTLLYFGYTHCPDVCPTHMASIAGALRALPAEDADRVTVVFATADPERDDAERLRDYLDLFDPSFIGLTGTLEETNRALASLGLPGVTIRNRRGEHYEVDHPSLVIAFTPDDLGHLVFPFRLNQDAWEHDLRRLLDEGWEEP
jgi:protein SCO1